MRPMVARRKALEPTLVEAGQAPTMAALGAAVLQRKDAFQALATQPLTQAEMVRHTGLTNRTAFGLVQACLDGSAGPVHGAVLSREQALAHPRLPEFWQVVDFVLAEDPLVHAHLYPAP